MPELLFDCGPEPKIIIAGVSGDLRVSGAARADVALVVTDAEDVTAQQTGDTLNLDIGSDAILSVPQRATVQMADVSGDLRLKDVQADFVIGTVSGDCRLRKVTAGAAGISIGAVEGELIAKYVAGNLTVGQIDGDVTARNLEGNLTSTEIGGGLYLRDVSGSVSAGVSGDATVRMQFQPDRSYRIQTGGDLTCRALPGTSARFIVRAGGDLSSDMPASADAAVFVMGGAEAEVYLEAGGDVSLIGKAAREASDADWDAFEQDISQWSATLGIEIADAVSSTVAERMADIDARLAGSDLPGDVQSKIAAKMERARRKVETSARRAEDRARRAADRAQARHGRGRRRAKVTILPGFDAPGTAPVANDPVSHEERVQILKMLEDGKITVEQAEMLLKALEGDA